MHNASRCKRLSAGEKKAEIQRPIKRKKNQVRGQLNNYKCQKKKKKKESQKMGRHRDLNPGSRESESRKLTTPTHRPCDRTRILHLIDYLMIYSLIT